MLLQVLRYHIIIHIIFPYFGIFLNDELYWLFSVWYGPYQMNHILVEIFYRISSNDNKGLQ